VVVVLEIHLEQFGVLSDAEAFPDEPIEVGDEIVRQIEGARITLAQGGECFVAREELIAMSSRQTHQTLGVAVRVELAAGAAIGVPDKDAVMGAFAARPIHSLAQCSNNVLGTVVVPGRQALNRHRELIELHHVEHLAGKCAAGHHEGARWIHRRRHDACAYAAERLAATSALAVSAATAASRQYASAPMAVPNSSFRGAPPTMIW